MADCRECGATLPKHSDSCSHYRERDEPNDQIAQTHATAMSAKNAIFTAQDALSRAWSAHAEAEASGDRDLKRDRLLRKIERRLGRCRSELEQLDNECLAARGQR